MFERKKKEPSTEIKKVENVVPEIISYKNFIKTIGLADIIERHDGDGRMFLFVVFESGNSVVVNYKKHEPISTPIMEYTTVMPGVGYLCFYNFLGRDIFLSETMIGNQKIGGEYDLMSSVCHDTPFKLVYNKVQKYNILIELNQMIIDELEYFFMTTEFGFNCIIDYHAMVFMAKFARVGDIYIYKLSPKKYLLSKGEVHGIIYYYNNSISIKTMLNERIYVVNNEVIYPYPYEHGKKIVFARDKFDKENVGVEYCDYLSKSMGIRYNEDFYDESSGALMLVDCVVDIRFMDKINGSIYLTIL